MPEDKKKMEGKEEKHTQTNTRTHIDTYTFIIYEKILKSVEAAALCCLLRLFCSNLKRSYSERQHSQVAFER